MNHDQINFQIVPSNPTLKEVKGAAKGHFLKSCEKYKNNWKIFLKF